MQGGYHHSIHTYNGKIIAILNSVEQIFYIKELTWIDSVLLTTTLNSIETLCLELFTPKQQWLHGQWAKHKPHADGFESQDR